MNNNTPKENNSQNPKPEFDFDEILATPTEAPINVRETKKTEKAAPKADEKVAKAPAKAEQPKNADASHDDDQWLSEILSEINEKHPEAENASPINSDNIVIPGETKHISDENFAFDLTENTPDAAPVGEVLPGAGAAVKKSGGSMLRLWAAAAIAVAIIVMALFVLLRQCGISPIGGDDKPAGENTVAVVLRMPYLLRNNEEDARKQLEATGFAGEIEFVHEYNDKYDIGEICEQSVMAESNINDVQKIVLTVSLGAKATVPSLDGMTVDEARTALEDARLKMVINKVVSEENMVNMVISQDIAAGTETSVGSNVTVDIGSGAAPEGFYITLNPSEFSLMAGNGSFISVTLHNLTDEDTSIVWSSSDPSIATVGEDPSVVRRALITAVKGGTAVITAATADGSAEASCTVIVTDVVTLTAIGFDKTEYSVSVGKSTYITPNLTPSNATKKTLAWTSSNERVVTVNESGRITGVSEGSATVTATAVEGGASASATVVVRNDSAVSGISVSPDTLALTPGTSKKLKANILPGTAENREVTWTVSDSSIATVAGDGTVTAVAVGTATVTATTADGGYAASVSVTVNRSDAGLADLRGMTEAAATAALRAEGYGVKVISGRDPAYDSAVVIAQTPAAGNTYDLGTVVTITVNATFAWGEWSETLPSDITERGYYTQLKTQYSSSTAEVLTSNKKTLDGAEYWKTVTEPGEWGPWSTWSELKTEESSTCRVQSKQQYRYRTRADVNKVYGLWSAWSDEIDVTESDTCEISERTLYRYSTCSLNLIYYFRVWSEWSEWSDTEVLEGDTVRVNTRTLYRWAKK